LLDRLRLGSLSQRLKLRPAVLPLGFGDLVRGSFWLILAAGFSQGSMLLANLLVANLLGVSGYGRYALLQTTVIVLAGLAQLSFGVVVAQQVSSLRERSPAMAGEVAVFCLMTTAAVSLLVAAALLIGRDALAMILFTDAALGPGVVLAALALPWFSISVVQQGLFNGLERFRDQTKISLVLSPLVVLLPAAGAYYRGFEGALAGLGAVYLLRVAVSHLFLMRVFRQTGLSWSLRNLRARLRLVWHYALPATLSGTMLSLAVFGGQTLLVRTGPANLGLFAAAFALKTMVMFLPSQMIGVLLPVLSRSNARPERHDGRALLYTNLVVNLSIIFVLAGIGVLFAPQIMALFGRDFQAGSRVLVILLLSAPFEAAMSTLYQDVQSKGYFWLPALTVNLPFMVVILGSAALLIPTLRAEGLALAWLFGSAVGLVGTIVAMTLRPRPKAEQAPAGTAS
jgi:O-antigen/teichoic acid export membrane protein